ncbi:hypothetical protein F4803DRAFT_557977 [Xylaria telfairii]|nr:hypothetical protein F4803DRAFT_557977 [Xylaria telfairii]
MAMYTSPAATDLHRPSPPPQTYTPPRPSPIPAALTDLRTPLQTTSAALRRPPRTPVRLYRPPYASVRLRRLPYASAGFRTALQTATDLADLRGLRRPPRT